MTTQEVEAQAPIGLAGERSALFELNPGDNQEDADLGFLAKSLRVDNPASQWWYLTNHRQWIAPWTIGMVINLHAPTQIADIRSLTPASAIIGVAPSGAEICTFIFYERTHQPTPGIRVAAGTA